MSSLVQSVRHFLGLIRRPTVHAARLATRFQRATMYGLDLVLWSRLFSSRRSPIPIELPKRLMEAKEVRFTPPVLHLSGPPARALVWDEGFAAVNAALFLNLQTPDVLSRLRYAHPAPAFQGVYLWDSAFIAQIWKHWDPVVAHDILQAVMDLRDGDRLQHVVADVVSSPYTQPPLIAWSLVELLRMGGPGDQLGISMSEKFQCLSAYQDWLRTHRRHPSGLYFWEHAYESGVENAPRFGPRDERKLRDTRKMASPDLCAYVVVNLEALAGLAQREGNREAAQRFLNEAAALRDRVNETLWHEGDGFYYDRDFTTGEFVRSRSIAGLLPLWAAIPDDRRAARLLAGIMDARAFNTRMPLPSVARDDPSYECDMWRGPVWINTAYAVIQGMQRHGFHREAADVAWRLCDGVYQTHAGTRRIHEFYDPDRHEISHLNRKLGNRWKALTLGNKPRPEFVGWSGLVNTLVIEHLIGIVCREGKPSWQPRFPPQAAGIGFSLRLPALDLALHVEVLDEEGRASGTFRQGNLPPRRLEASFGEMVALD